MCAYVIGQVFHGDKLFWKETDVVFLLSDTAVRVNERRCDYCCCVFGFLSLELTNTFRRRQAIRAPFCTTTTATYDPTRPFCFDKFAKSRLIKHTPKKKPNKPTNQRTNTQSETRQLLNPDRVALMSRFVRRPTITSRCRSARPPAFAPVRRLVRIMLFARLSIPSICRSLFFPICFVDRWLAFVSHASTCNFSRWLRHGQWTVR